MWVMRSSFACKMWDDATSAIDEVVPFATQPAKASGDLIIQTRRLGLSPDDRACLAPGIVRNAPVSNTEKTWKKLKLGIPAHLIRSMRVACC